MQILGNSISEHCAALVCEIESCLSRPVKYQFAKQSQTKSYGRTDISRPEAYYVYSKESLYGEVFENNILHELCHLCQIEEGYPTTSPKYTDIYSDPIGSLIISSILDLNVDYRLKRFGYDSHYFYRERLRIAKSFSLDKNLYANPIEFVQMSISLICLKILYPVSEMDIVLSNFQRKNQGLVNSVRVLSQEILETGYNDVISSFNSLICLFNGFNLWSTHQINFKGRVFPSFSSVQKYRRDTQPHKIPPES